MCKRYIDAYALEYRVEDFEKLTGMKVDIVHDFVSSQPTADVVEVVRCKDCVYREVKGEGMTHWFGCRIMEHNDDDWYCSYGEREK